MQLGLRWAVPSPAIMQSSQSMARQPEAAASIGFKLNEELADQHAPFQQPAIGRLLEEFLS